MVQNSAGLYGLKHSNHDFSKRENWGKNIFNNAFPTALVCYMASRNIQPVYYRLDSNLNVNNTYLTVREFFNIDPNDDDIFFSFETDYAPYRPLIEGVLPRADLIISTRSDAQSLRAIEIKLTALPDNSTHKLPENQYSCEIVVRPDTIVYMALTIANEFVGRQMDLQNYLQDLSTIRNWSDKSEIVSNLKTIAQTLNNFMLNNLHLQQPLIMQPIWKTKGKQLSLHKDAFDVFIWSDFAFTRLFFRDVDKYTNGQRTTITRGARSIVWLAKMLYDFAINGKIDTREIIDALTLGTKNDKAFAVNGKVTHPFMTCDELSQPRIKRDEIRHIILGGGENFLSPERRLDAAIAGTPDLFED